MTQRKRYLILAALVCSTLAGVYPADNAYAAENTSDLDEYALDEVVVTASKTEEDLFKAKANVDVITRETLENKHYQSLVDALNDVPGVTVENYGNGGANYSSGQFYMNGSDRVVFLIDGMRVNSNGSSSNKLDASTLVDMDTIERIEVVKGSDSTLYGSDAAGGVVNIITRKNNKGRMKTTLSASRGSFGKEKYNMTTLGSDERGLSWMASWQKDISGNFSDGHGNNVLSHINSDTLSFKLRQDFNKDTSLTATYDSYKSNYMRPDYGGLSETKEDIGRKNNSRFSMDYSSRLSRDITNRVYIYRNRTDLRDNIDRSLWAMDLETRGISDQVTYKGTKHTVIGGFDWYQDQIKLYVASGNTFGGKSTTDRSFYLQDDWQFIKKWDLTTGVRVNYHSLYGQHTTPSVTLGYDASDRLNLYMSYKKFFVSPVMSQLYSKYGDPNLKPETGRTLEFGTNYRFDNTFSGSFHIFKRYGDNMISYNASTGKYANISNERAKGWDIKLNKKFDNHWNMNVGLTYLSIAPASAKENSNRNGYLPRETWNLGVTYVNRDLNFSIDTKGTIDRRGRKGYYHDEGSQTFWIWNAAVNYKINTDTKAYFRINNIFNKFYTQMSYDMNPDGSWYSAPGRNFELGLQYSF